VESSIELVAGATGEKLSVRLDRPESAGAEARSEALCILYLHGFGSTQSGEKATYFRQAAVQQGWAFCSFDFRGHGASEGSMFDLTLSRTLEDVSAVRGLLAGRGYTRLALFGSSMGGAVALWEAALRPAGIAAAAHIAPAVGFRAGLERWAGPAGLERWRRTGSIRFANELVECDLGWGLMEDLAGYDLDRLVALYRTPTLIFQGKRDESVDWRDVADFARRLRPSLVDLRLYEDAAHRLTDRKHELWDGARTHFCAYLDAF